MRRVLFLLIIACFAGCTCKTSGKETFLYVLLSNDGEIRQVSDGSYELVLDNSAVEQLIAFSNRPVRIEKHITASEFHTVWEEGENSFQKDPPNATVIINQNPQVVELLSNSVDAKRVTFKIRSDGSKPIKAMRGKTQIFVDGCVRWYPGSGCV